MIRVLLAATLVMSALLVGDPADAAAPYRTSASAVRSMLTGQVAVAKAHCPRGTSVSSGGVTVDGVAGAVVLASAPFDDRDRDRRPDDGWRAVARNDSGSGATLRAFAVCSRFGRYNYRSVIVDVPSGGLGTSTVLCANNVRDSVVGGGTALLAAGSGLSLAGSGPFDDDTETSDSTPDDGWTSQASNTTGQVVRMRVTAICEAKGTYVYPTTPVNVVSGGDPFAVPVSCEEGDGRAGGGGTVNGSVELLRSVPVGVLFDGAGDSWTVTVRNETGKAVSVVTTAICRR